MKKFALVLSGGGFKGAFQVGALRQLQENWKVIHPEGDGVMKFDVIAGVSVGSLNGVLTASNALNELEQLWIDIGANVENIYTSDFIDTKDQSGRLGLRLDFNRIKQRFIPNLSLKLSLWEGLGMLLSKSKRKKYIDQLLAEAERDFVTNFKNFRALADNTPLKNRLNELVRIDMINECIFKCGFVSLDDGVYHSYRHTEFRSDDDFRKGILASTAMPIVWEPVARIEALVKGETRSVVQAVDGGIRNVSPLGDVIEEINRDDPQSEYTIIIINCNSGVVDYESYESANIAGIALRALNDIAITEIFNNDVAEFLRINDIIHQAREINPSIEIRHYSLRLGRTDRILRPYKAIIVQTDPGILGDALVSNHDLNLRRMEHGKMKASQALDVLRGDRTDRLDLVVV